MSTNKIKGIESLIKSGGITTIRIFHLDYAMKFHAPFKVTVLDGFHMMISSSDDDDVYINISSNQIYYVTVGKDSELIIELK